MKTKSEIREILKKIRLKEKNLIGSDCIALKKFCIIIKNIRKNFKIKNVSIYYPIKNEISPLKVLEVSKLIGFNLCLPKIIIEEGELIFEKCNNFENLKKSFYGTYELRDKGEIVIPEIIFVPLLACDLKFNRLGYGKGYYDKTIYKIRKLKKIFVIGLGYDKQVIDKVPVDDNDEKLDFIMTERRIFRNNNLK